MNSQSGSSQAEMLNKLNDMLGDLGKLDVICLSLVVMSNKSKKEGIDQELIQSITIPDPGRHLGK